MVDVLSDENTNVYSHNLSPPSDHKPIYVRVFSTRSRSKYQTIMITTGEQSKDNTSRIFIITTTITITSPKMLSPRKYQGDDLITPRNATKAKSGNMFKMVLYVVASIHVPYRQRERRKKDRRIIKAEKMFAQTRAYDFV